MYDLGIKYGIDPAYALAFFINESSAGTQGIATVTKSIGNIRVTPGYENYQGFRKYPGWDAGIEDWYKLIKNLYVDGWGLNTVEKIVPVYAPAADNNNPAAYIKHVNNLVAQWRSGS
jgi:flagellum-specific peptidoglycan hydrolase FlgJ